MADAAEKASLAMEMPFTGERYVPELRGQIYYEHGHRYAVALDMARDLDVLDIASGEGYGAAYLAIVARSVIGVDIDPAAVRHAALRYTAMNLFFREGSCTSIPLAPESVDLVVSFETIEHITEHEQFMREIVRVLRSNGRLVMSSPNKLVYSDRSQQQNVFHVRELYFDELRDLLEHWFPHCRLYGQRLFAASAIHPLRGVAPDARCIGPATHQDERGLPALPAPTYFVAVCSLSKPEHDYEPLNSVFVDPGDDLLEHIVHPEEPLALPRGVRDDVLKIESTPGCARIASDLSDRTIDSDADLVDGLTAQAANTARSTEFEEELIAVSELETLRAKAAQDAEQMLEWAARERDALAERDALQARFGEAGCEIARLEDIVERLGRERDDAADMLRRASESAADERVRAAEEASRIEQQSADAEVQAEFAKRECETLRARLAELQTSLRDSVARGAADGVRADDLSRALDDIRAELSRTGWELARTRAELGDIVNSASWRVTRPIRVALRRLRG